MAASTPSTHPSARLPRPSLVLFAILMLALCVAALCQLDLYLSTVSLTTLATPAAGGLSPTALALARTAFALAIAHSLHYRVTSPRIVISPLRNAHAAFAPVSVLFGGPMVFSTFTVQCWTLQLFYFTGAAACSLASLSGATLPSGPLASAVAAALWIAFEVSFAVSMLTTAVVTFVLIPKTIKEGKPPDNFFGYPQQCMHNLNVLTVATELLFGSLPIAAAHLPFVCMWGLNYVVFSWPWLYRTGLSYYPFLDPTIPASKSIPLHGLVLGVLSLFYFMGYVLANASAYLPLSGRALLLYGGACSIMWTRWHSRPVVKLDPKAGSFGG